MDEKPDEGETEENGEKKEEETKEIKPEEEKIEEVKKDEKPSAKSGQNTATVVETKIPNVPSGRI